VVVDEGDRAGRVPHQVAGGQLVLADPDGVAVVDEHVRLDRDPLGVVAAGVGSGAGGLDDGGERLPVVPVPVGGHDGRDAVRADQLQQRLRLRGGVDQELLAGLAAAQQVGVVVHGADRDLGDHQVGQL